MRKRISYRVMTLAVLAALLVLASCSTKKNRWVNRTYHNITGYYNAYFNGNEAYKEGVVSVSDAHTDNYSLILPVFRLADATASQAAAPKFDRAITKASKVINKHSMYFRNVEYNKVVDDAYLLIGKSNFYKREYMQANASFSFIVSRFAKQSIRNDAMMWLALVAVMEGNYTKAESTLDVVTGRLERETVSKEVRKTLHMVYAELYLRQSKYRQAAQSLELAIKAGPSKKTRTRLTFILAQVQQEIGNLDEAASLYRKVLKMNPAYEMAFHSQINMARCFSKGMARKYDVEKLLNKMLKDVKNKDYLDEIYFSLAEIALKDGKRVKAKEYLKLSVESSVTNNMQKAVSSLKLAELTFEDQEYTLAQAYFDTTVAFLPKTYPNYDAIADKQKILSGLVQNLLVIEAQDSLQRLAKMSEAQRMAVIDKIINDIIRIEQEQMREEAERMMSLNILQQDRTQQSVTQAGQWYFYNPSAMSFGFTEFTKKWGKRKLEDNWRLSNKEITAFDFAEGDAGLGDEGDEVEGGNGTGKSGKSSPKDRKTYLKNIPLTPEMMRKSDSLLATAIYNSGDIYKNKLNENYKAIEYYDRFEKNYQDDSRLVAVYYQMYRIYSELQNRDKAAYYLNLLKTRFPDTDYYKLAADPDYYKSLLSEQEKAEKAYAGAYADYQQNRFSQVLEKQQQAHKEFKSPETLARFDYLAALVIGKTKDKEDFKTALESVVRAYANTASAAAAQNILDYINQTGIHAPVSEATGTSESGQPDSKDPKKPSYSYEPATIHLCVIVVNVKNVTVNDIKVAFSDHNTEYFSTDKLSVSAIYLDNTRQIVTISNFKNEERGMAYLNAFKINGVLSGKLEQGQAEQFIMSVNNYSMFVKSRNVEEYKEFFTKHYIR